METVALGLLLYVVALLTMGGIYAVLALGLNVQWGFTGLFNAGIAGFFAIGAYTSAILTTLPAAHSDRVFGAELPLPLAWLLAMLTSGLIAVGIGRICLRLRSDYLAIGTIGIAEILRLFFKNEAAVSNGARGIPQLPKPFEQLPQPWEQLAFLALVIVIVAVLYGALERALNSPWGRMMKAIRENERAAAAMGKNIERRRLEAFVLGAMIMGLGGALMAHSFKFIGPEATEPLMTTFLVWVMLIAGGSGNNRGAIIGAVGIWAIWSLTEIMTSGLPPEWAVRASYIRIFLIGLLLQIVLQRFPGGLFPERSQVLVQADRSKRAPAAAE